MIFLALLPVVVLLAIIARHLMVIRELLETERELVQT